LYFIPANDKKHPVKYEGELDVGAMLTFLFQHRTTPVGKGSGLFDALREK
jgi:hypothetical protein